MSAPFAQRREPVFNMPALVVAAVAILLAIHALRHLLSDVADFSLVLDYGFIPAQWSLALGTASVDDIVAGASIGSGENAATLGGAFANLVTGADLHPWSLVTYAALHGSWAHVVLNCVWLAAFATPLVRRCGNVRALGLAFVSVVAGAVAHWLAYPTGVQPLIGASAIVSAYMAAAATFVFEQDALDATQIQAGSRLTRGLATLGRLARNRTALIFLGSWFVLNLVFGLLSEPLGVTDSAIAWEAHIGGFLSGLIVFPLIDPGPSWSRARPFDA